MDPLHDDTFGRILDLMHAVAGLAAASFGDEAYGIAMLLSDTQQQACLGDDWSVLGTDISDRVLRSAVEGVYPEEQLRLVDAARLKRHCLRGEGAA